jgi:hypothetical protein
VAQNIVIAAASLGIAEELIETSFILHEKVKINLL